MRIEKFIQNKFPGLRVDFSKGYDYLNESNFFAIQGVDVSKMSLIDRINLHFKLGVRALVLVALEVLVVVVIGGLGDCEDVACPDHCPWVLMHQQFLAHRFCCRNRTSC